MNQNEIVAAIRQMIYQSNYDGRVVIDELFADFADSTAAQIAQLTGVDADTNAFLANLRTLLDSDPDSPGYQQGQNIPSLIVTKFAEAKSASDTAQAAAEAAAAVATAVQGQLTALAATVNALSADYTAFKGQTALDFQAAEADYIARDAVIAASVVNAANAAAAATQLLRSDVESADAVMRTDMGVVAQNAADNLATAKTQLRAEATAIADAAALATASAATTAHNENDALATMLTQDIATAAANAAAALNQAKGVIAGDINSAAATAAQNLTAAIGTEAASRVSGDNANAAAAAAAQAQADSLNAALVALVGDIVSGGTAFLEGARGWRKLPSAYGTTYTPPVFTTAWTVADVAASVAYLATSDGDMFGNSISGNLLGTGFDVAGVTSITHFVPGTGNVTTAVVSGMDPIHMFAPGAAAGSIPAGILSVAPNGTYGYVRMAGANNVSPAPATFVATHQNGNTDSSTLTITHLPN